MPVAPAKVASAARVFKPWLRKDMERMALDMPQIDDIRRLWSEGWDVTEIARVTDHERQQLSLSCAQLLSQQLRLHAGYSSKMPSNDMGGIISCPGNWEDSVC